MSQISVQLRQDTEAALLYLLGRWFEGAGNKRNATIQRAIREAAEREARQELAERNAQ